MRPRIGITMSYGKGSEGEFFSLKVNYVRMVEGYGGIAHLIFPVEGAEARRSSVETVDGLILSGGRDIPPSYYGEERHYRIDPVNRLRTDFEMRLLEEFLLTGKPVLGLCYGAQLINVVRGGTLYQDISSQMAKASVHEGGRHFIKVCGKTKLSSLVGETTSFEVNSNHHQAVKHPGKGIASSAIAMDGVVEAIEIKDHPFCVGLQWHPEKEPEDRFTGMIVRGFIEACT